MPSRLDLFAFELTLISPTLSSRPIVPMESNKSVPVYGTHFKIPAWRPNHSGLAPWLPLRQSSRHAGNSHHFSSCDLTTALDGVVSQWTDKKQIMRYTGKQNIAKLFKHPITIKFGGTTVTICLKSTSGGVAVETVDIVSSYALTSDLRTNETVTTERH